MLVMLEYEPYMYNLAAYISLRASNEISALRLESVSPACRDALDRWESVSQSYYERQIHVFEQTCGNLDAEFAKLCTMFRCDFSHFFQIQEIYADRIISQKALEGCSECELEHLLEILYPQRAYVAYFNVYQYAALTGMPLKCSLRESYVESLLQLHRFAEAIAFLDEDNQLPPEHQKELLRRTICDNFSVYGITEEAFSIFSSKFSVEKATELLMGEINGTTRGFAAVAALIAIHAYADDLLRAMYLYSMFQDRGECGYTKIYTHFRSRCGNAQIKSNLQNNHYNVIEIAFQSLSVDDLIDFLQWAGKVKIIGFKEYQPSHVYDWYFDRLLEDPMHFETWDRFYTHLVKHSDVTAWMICVCNSVLSQKFHITDTQNIYKAVELVLDNADEKSIPINFLEIACSYIMTSGNIHLCKKMYEQLNHEGICNKVTDRNPWTGRRPQVLEVFNRYCIDNYKETGNPLYYALLKLLQEKSGDSDLHELSDLSVSKQFLFNKICQNYLDGTNFGEMVSLINNDSWRDLTFVEAEMLALLKMVYSDNTMLLHANPMLYKDESELERIKRDCIDAVKDYPKLDEGVERFRQSANSVEHKLVVYAHIFGICYTRDIYKECTFETIPFDNERAQMAYCAFQSKAYFAQLQFETSYQFFYLRWRYQKLYIMEKVQFGNQADDLAIISAMESNGHTQYVLENDYLPFKQDVNTFYGYEDIPLEARKLFLINLANGRIQYFLEHYANLVAGLRKDQKAVIKSLIARVDYREANRGLFIRYLQDICTGNMDQALTVAEAISDFAVVTLNALDKCPDRVQACAYLNDIAVKLSTKDCFDQITKKMDDEQFAAYEALLVPMLCACELDFQIYRRLRLQILNRKKKISNERYMCILTFLQKYDPFAQNIAIYLQALTACMEGRRDVATKIISQSDISIGIPEEWRKEAELIRKYAARTDDAPFEPDRRISDSSRFSRGQEIEFRFTKALIHAFGTQWETISDSRILEVLEEFSSKTETVCNRIKAGLLILGNYQKMADKLRAVNLPHTNLQLSFRIGMLALESVDVISDDLKLLIAAELFDVRNSLESELRFALYTQFEAVLKKQISFAAWCENHAMIERFVRVIQNDTAFEKLQRRVLIPGLALYKPECTLEERFAKLGELSGACYGSKSIYEENVCGAIEREIQLIENGPRLRVKIVNENARVMDDTVYFQIENNGRHTVFLDSADCTVLVSTEDSSTGQVVPLADICELRPNYVTGGRCPVSVDEKGRVVSVSVQIRNQLICRTEETLIKALPPERIRVNATINYNVDYAVDDEEALFGREEEKLLLKHVIPKGKTVIYGPSRIGKTSLLNWVCKSYAVSQENVITVLLGGETNKMNDYVRHARNGTPLQYDDTSMTEYLLVDSILAGFEEAGRFGEGKVRLPEDAKCKIQQILEDKSKCVRIRHSNVSKLLREAGLELWILLDEFQQAVEKWTPDIGGEFVDACQQLNKDSNIKLILCGSDDLLKHMVLEDNSVWRKLFPHSCRIPVGPLKETPFAAMIQEDKIVSATGLHYCAEALDTLYKYTGGVALYGKQICNAVLKDIVADSACFANRDIVYPSDIARATQHLLKQQATELDTKMSEGIRDIYDAVTKNLDEDTDMQYLYYIARWLADHPDKKGFPQTEFTDHALYCTKKELLDSLRVAEERRIIRNESLDTKTPVYVFNTLFYYYAFRGLASQNLDEDKIFAREVIEAAEDIAQKMLTIEEIVSETQAALSKGVLNGTISMDQLNNARMLLGNNTWNTVNNQGGSIEYNKDVGTVNKSTLNIGVQSITNTLNTLLTGEIGSAEFRDALSAMPTVSGCLGEMQKNDLLKLIEELADCDTETDIVDTEARITEVTAPAEQKILSDFSGAVIESDGFITVSDERKIDLLHLSGKEELDRIWEKLPEFVGPLDFAMMLHNMFAQIACRIDSDSRDAGAEQLQELDYCPVAIMYCKVVEAILKRMHTPLYIKKLGTDPISGNSNILFRDLLEADGKTIRHSKDLTIGSFAFPIVIPDRDHQDINKPDEFSSTPKKSKIRRLTDLKDDSLPINQKWAQHARALAIIRAIRNKSAHEAAPISKANFDWLIEVLFRKGELIRIAELANNQL